MVPAHRPLEGPTTITATTAPDHPAPHKEVEGLMAVPRLLWRSRAAQLMALSSIGSGMFYSFSSGTFSADVVAASLGQSWFGPPRL